MGVFDPAYLTAQWRIDAIKLFRTGKPIPQIASLVGMPFETVARALNGRHRVSRETDPEIVRTVIEMRLARIPYGEIAKELGLTKYVVEKLCQEVPKFEDPRSIRFRLWSEEARKLNEQGMRPKEIAKELNVDWRTVYKVLKRQREEANSPPKVSIGITLPRLKFLEKEF